MNHIFIATTALNRPDLHKTVFHKWYKLLNTLNYKIIHFINIDYIDKGYSINIYNEYSFEEFKTYTNSILNDTFSYENEL